MVLSSYAEPGVIWYLMTECLVVSRVCFFGWMNASVILRTLQRWSRIHCRTTWLLNVLHYFSFFSTPCPNLSLPFINGNLHRGMDCVYADLCTVFSLFHHWQLLSGFIIEIFWQNLGILVQKLFCHIQCLWGKSS